jgi:hypothetical protein
MPPIRQRIRLSSRLCLLLRPFVAPLCCAPLVVHSGWLLCCLLSRRRLSSTCASASHCTAACHCAPLAPLVRLVVASPLITPPSLVRLRLCLSSHHHLLLGPSYAFVWMVVMSPLVTLPPPISLCLRLSSHLLSGWLLHHLLSCRRLCLSLHRRLSLHPSCASYLADGCITSRHAATSCPPAPLPLSTLLPHTTPLSR